MTEVECTTRKFGGSIGVILPKDIVDKEGIKPDQKIKLEIRRVKVRDVLGILPNIKTPTQKLMDEARKGW